MATLYVHDSDLPPLSQRGVWRWSTGLKVYAGTPNLTNYTWFNSRMPFTPDTIGTYYGSMYFGDRFATHLWPAGQGEQRFLEFYVRGNGTLELDFGFDLDYTGGAIFYDETDEVYLPPDYEDSRPGGEGFIDEWIDKEVITSSGSQWTRIRIPAPTYMEESPYWDAGYTVCRFACVAGSIDLTTVALAMPNAEGKIYLRNGDDRQTSWNPRPDPTFDWIPGSTAGRGDNRMWTVKLFFNPRSMYVTPSVYPLPESTALQGYDFMMGSIVGMLNEEFTGSFPMYTTSESPAIYGGTEMPGSAFGFSTFNEDEFYPPIGYIPPSHNFVLPDVRDTQGYVQKMVLSPTFFESVLTDPDHYPPGWKDYYTGQSTVDYLNRPIWEDGAATFLGWAPIRFTLRQYSRGIGGDLADEYPDTNWKQMGIWIGTSNWEPGEPLPAPYSGETIWTATSPGSNSGDKIVSPWWKPPSELTWGLQIVPTQGTGHITVGKESMDPSTGDVISGPFTYSSYARILFQMPRWAVLEYGWQVFYDNDSVGGGGGTKISPFQVLDREAAWPKIGSEDPDLAAGRFRVSSPTGWDKEYFPEDGTTYNQNVKMLNAAGEWEPVSKEFEA